MIGAGRGLIVNLTWVLDRPHGHAFYAVVKNATNRLTQEMADDLRPHPGGLHRGAARLHAAGTDGPER